MQADAAPTALEQPSQHLDTVQLKPSATAALATVVSGEASESDEDDATYSCMTDSRCSTSQSMSLDGSFSGRRFSESSRHNSLLHRKLRERNANLRKQLTQMACQPYQNATKEVSAITQGLIRSQQLVQEVTATLRRLTNELFQLEDKVETVRHCSIIPDITMNAYGAVPSER